MPQTFVALLNDDSEAVVQMPGPDDEVIPGVRWGRFDVFFTPAFWFMRAWYGQRQGCYSHYRLGRTLREEIAACLLGGHGMPAEVGLAAFARVRDEGFLEGTPSEAALFAALSQPLVVGQRSIRYRYPKQRARFLARALERLDREKPPCHTDLALREWLLGFDGIGLKTASWITRNHLDSDNVAILDIHLQRAGILAGVFEKWHLVTRHYRQMESRLVQFAQALGVKLAILDALMWYEMRQMSPVAIDALSGLTDRSPKQMMLSA